MAIYKVDEIVILLSFESTSATFSKNGVMMLTLLVSAIKQNSLKPLCYHCSLFSS